MSNFTHLDKNGNIKMVDITNKDSVKRIAKATGKIFLDPKTIDLINKGQIKKGNVLTTAKIAGINAAKNTFSYIPLCHQIQLTNVDIEFNINSNNIEILSNVICIDKTGAEMEALNSVAAAALTIYDMCKAVDKKIIISDIKLIEKSKNKI